MNISGLYQFSCLSLIKDNIRYKHSHTPHTYANAHTHIFTISK